MTGSFQAYLAQSHSAREMGDLARAADAALAALKLSPEHPDALHQLGVCYLDLRRFSEAEPIFRRLVKLLPNHAQIHYGLGKCLQGTGRNLAAITEFSKAASSEPNEPVFLSLANAYMAESEPLEAKKYATRALKLDPESWRAHLLLSRACMDCGDSAKAMEHMLEAKRIRPDDSLVVAAYGKLLRNLGRIEEAGEQFDISIQADPDKGNAYFASVYNRRVTESDRPLVLRMEALCSSGEVSRLDLIHLEYGLGKAFDDLAEYEKAMSHYDVANRLARYAKFGDQAFDLQAVQSNTQFAIQFFNGDLMNAYRGLGSASDVPIFVVGMMRSGTTLAEQILSSHPAIGGAGELRFWSEHRADALRADESAVDFVKLNALALDYLSELSRLAPDKARVVDKMPANYSMIGLIHLAFPRAKIIHLVRNPVDTCLSIYATPNRSRIGWAHDKANIVFAFREYESVMAHWKRVLPHDVMIDVRYEDLVSNQEDTSRALVRFCGLPWDDACLHPESNERSVLTPSVWQVRQPVYKTSVDRWRRYEPWLGEFKSLLQPDERVEDASIEDLPFALTDRDVSSNEAIWLYRRAAAMLWMRRDFEAVVPLRSAIQLDPNPDSLVKLGNLELDLGDPGAGLAAAEQAIRIEPRHLAANVLAAKTLMAAGHDEQATEAWERARLISPPESKELVDTLRAKLLFQNGDFGGGTDVLKQVLKEFPRSTSAMYQLIAGKRVSERDRDLIERVKGLLEGPGIEIEERLDLEYALGKAYDDLADYENALRHFDVAHRAELSKVDAHEGFNAQGYAANISIRMKACNSQAMSELALRGNLSSAPIFVTGMIRSGTTLAEQILSSHPEVAGAGELTHWTNADIRLLDYATQTLNEHEIRQVADEYVEIVRRFKGSVKHAVDKQPGNLTLAGVLHVAFPNARIIYMVRNPVDTAVSIWTTRLTTTAPFVHDRANIVTAIREHERLRRHWREVLPESRFLEVSYEALVKDREAETRRLLNFCGLGWSDDCMVPERTRRSVLTPSNWQVRQPVYDTSVNRWKHYERWLGEFRRLIP